MKWLAEKQAERDARAARLAKAAPQPIVEHAPKRSRKHAVMAPSEVAQAAAVGAGGAVEGGGGALLSAATATALAAGPATVGTNVVALFAACGGAAAN